MGRSIIVIIVCFFTATMMHEIIKDSANVKKGIIKVLHNR